MFTTNTEIIGIDKQIIKQGLKNQIESILIVQIKNVRTSREFIRFVEDRDRLFDYVFKAFAMTPEEIGVDLDKIYKELKYK